jgi:hypothetical protein
LYLVCGQHLKEWQLNVNQIPWLEKVVKFQVKAGPYRGYKIEEVRVPWDLFIEGRLVGTNLGDEKHVSLVTENQERIFSLRNQHREPEASIVCIPPDSEVMKESWTKERILKTSKTMIIDDQPLRAITILARHGGKTVPSDMIKVFGEFFQEYGGILDNEWPGGMIIKKEEKKKSEDKGWNLCVASKLQLTNDCSTHRFHAKEAIQALKSSTYDDVYLWANDEWMEEVVEYLKNNPKDAPKRTLYVFGDKSKRRKLMDRYNAKT